MSYLLKLCGSIFHMSNSIQCHTTYIKLISVSSYFCLSLSLLQHLPKGAGPLMSPGAVWRNGPAGRGDDSPLYWKVVGCYVVTTRLSSQTSRANEPHSRAGWRCSLTEVSLVCAAARARRFPTNIPDFCGFSVGKRSRASAGGYRAARCEIWSWWRFCWFACQQVRL